MTKSKSPKPSISIFIDELVKKSINDGVVKSFITVMSANVGVTFKSHLQTAGIGVIAGTRCVSTPALTPFMGAKQCSPPFVVAL